MIINESSQICELMEFASTAFWRGQIMARMVPARVTGVAGNEVFFSRPLGLNPYYLFSEDFRSFDLGYSEETRKMYLEKRKELRL